MPKKKEIGAADFIAGMNATAEQLSAVRASLCTREEDFKKETDALYDKEKSLKEELLGALKTIGLSSVKTAGGESYLISKKFRFAVNNPIELESYARDAHCVTIDKRMLNAHFTKAMKENKLPDFVVPEPYETISIKSAKKEDDTTTDSG